MKPKITTLKNNAEIITLEAPSSKSVTIGFGFRVGSRDENPLYAGISHFLEHMMFKGSKKRPSAMLISKEADQIGANYNAFTGKEFTYYYINAAKKDFYLALDIVGDMVTRPLIKSNELAKEKGTIIEEIKRKNDTPLIAIYDEMEKTLFGQKSPVGREILGEIRTVKNTNAKVMRDYFDYFYNGSNLVVALAGSLPKDYSEKVKGYALRFGKGRRATRETPSFKKTATRIIGKETDQAHLGLCLPSYGVNSKSKYAAQIISTAIGGYMSSRLFTEIREKRGWAYSIFSQCDVGSDFGHLAITGGIKKEKMTDALKIILAEVRGFEDSFKEEEVERAKSHLAGSITLKYANPEKRIGHLSLRRLIADDQESPEEYIRKIQAVTTEEIKRVANEMCTKNELLLTIIGPYQNKEKFDKILKSG